MKIFTVDEVATLVGVSANCIREWCHSGKLVAAKMVPSGKRKSFFLDEAAVELAKQLKAGSRKIPGAKAGDLVGLAELKAALGAQHLETLRALDNIIAELRALDGIIAELRALRAVWEGK